jgi:predicted nucleic acid-binding protein
MPTRSSQKATVAEAYIVNASPLISLAKAGYLDLLEQLAETVLIPQPVAEEVAAGPSDDPARVALENGFGRVEPASVVPLELSEWGHGAGETAAIALALSVPGATVVLDDAAARTCARSHELPVVGSLGLIIRARKHGLISSAGVAVRALQSAGLHLDDTTVAAALKASVGEDWEPTP